VTELAITRAEVEDRFEEEMIDSVVMAAMLTMVIFLMMPWIQRAVTAASQPRVPVMYEGLEAIASNVGAMWYQITAAGYPNQLRMIGENSTGAFESMLLGLST
jgi:hypothetical protein